jgi:hypothetical protein
MTMFERAVSPLRPLSRRTVVKGLVGVTLTLTGIGCAPVRSSPPTAPALSPVPTTPPQPGALGTTLLTYHGYTATIYAVVWHDTRIASGGADQTVQVWDR